MHSINTYPNSYSQNQVERKNSEGVLSFYTILPLLEVVAEYEYKGKSQTDLDLNLALPALPVMTLADYLTSGASISSLHKAANKM